VGNFCNNYFRTNALRKLELYIFYSSRRRLYRIGGFATKWALERARFNVSFLAATRERLLLSFWLCPDQARIHVHRKKELCCPG